MIAFPGMLVGAAEQAGMKVPPDPEGEFDREEFPHFYVFCALQIGRPLPNWSAHWNNAYLIASISDEDIRTFSFEDFLMLGLE